MNTIFTFQKQPRLTLVGAGPGDPELITLKAVNALKAADIVLYDALVSEEILDLIPSTIPVMPVGKRAGSHSFAQEEINTLIVEFAYLYGHVVRLKGGDPFVFGRGMEEIEIAVKNGIETAVVPGISSAFAVPASMDIPVTARGVSESFWVVTGTTSAGEVSSDLKLAAQSTATVIVLMGLNKIVEIMEIYTALGRSNTPVAVIQNGTLHSQQSVVGTVSSIVDMVTQEKIASPAVIIIGDVVKYARDLHNVVSIHAANS
jgi:uroporphyrin-III C-methyltransferase